jgi:hypothetical protein
VLVLCQLHRDTQRRHREDTELFRLKFDFFEKSL